MILLESIPNLLPHSHLPHPLNEGLPLPLLAGPSSPSHVCNVLHHEGQLCYVRKEPGFRKWFNMLYIRANTVNENSRVHATSFQVLGALGCSIAGNSAPQAACQAGPVHSRDPLFGVFPAITGFPNAETTLSFLESRRKDVLMRSPRRTVR